MSGFKYEAKTLDGRTVKGKVNADSQEKFLADIKNKGLYLIKYSDVVEENDILSMGKTELPLKELAIFSRQISSLLGVGISLVKALDIMYQQTSNKKMKESIQKLYESVQKGSLLSEAMRKQTGKYPSIMISLVESGEASGTLDEAVEKLATQFESDLRLKNKVTSAMVYPAALAVLGTGVVILMVSFVLPKFVNMFNSAGITELPLPTAMLIGLSNLVAGYWYFILFAIFAVVAFFQSWLKTDSGRFKWDSFKFKVPVLKSILPNLIAVRFCRTFVTLFSSGMPVLQALAIVMNVVDNKLVATDLSEASEDIRKGMPLAQSLRRVTAFPPMVHSMVLIGEESGSLETMLENASEYFNDELENSIARMVALIEPVMIIIMAILVGFIILSILLPMMQIYNNI